MTDNELAFLGILALIGFVRMVLQAVWTGHILPAYNRHWIRSPSNAD